MDPLAQAILTSFRGEERPDLTSFIRLFQERFPHNLEAVILYGSRLSPQTARANSIHDFIIVLRRWRGSRVPLGMRLLSPLLSPTSLSAQTEDGALCKGFVLTQGELEAAVSPRSWDLYVAGRLGKRVLPLWTTSSGTWRWLAQSMARAIRALRPLVLLHLPWSFTLEEFIFESLRVSYRGEWRVERPEKVWELYRSAQEYYGELYSISLEELVREGLVEPWEGGYRLTPAGQPSAPAFQRGRIRATQLLGVARWPKHMLTVSHWPEIMIAKIERSLGEPLNLSPWLRRHPALATAPVFFKLLSRRRLHSNTGSQP